MRSFIRLIKITKILINFKIMVTRRNAVIILAVFVMFFLINIQAAKKSHHVK